MPEHANAQTPPHDVDAETSVLGSVLLDPSSIAQIPWLRPEDLYRENNGLVLRAIRSLFARGEPVDFITLGAELERMGVLDRIGGRAHLARLQEDAITAANIVHYASRVRELALKRRAIQKGQDVVRAGFDLSLDAKQTIAVAQRAAFELADYAINEEPETISDLLERFMDRMQDAKSSGLKGLSTGFGDMDIVVRGLRAGDLTIIAGRPSMGKSALGVQIAFNVAKRYGPVAVFSLEMTKDQIIERLVSCESRIDKERLDRGNLSDREWGVLSDVLGPLAEVPLYIDEQRSLDDLTLQAKVRNLALSREVTNAGGLQLVVLDYLQLLKSSRDFRNDRVREVGHFSQSLKALAGEMRVPVIAMSQLSREPEKRPDKRPILSDLRESGSLEQDADIVGLLFRPDYYERDPGKWNQLCEVNVAKNRNGATGDVTLRFVKNQTRFEDQSRRDEPPPQEDFWHE